MSLAARIRELRLRSGQSLQKVADAVGVSKTHIWELEKGRSHNPSVELLAKLADHFKVTITSLVGEDLEADGADEQLMRMFRQAGELEEQDRAVLDDMIRSMLKRRKARGAPD
ncbi:MAG: helix-turn-helix transcriptional regulator [Proteobacteria bacterium]|nr:helix-turn-helix transcriptional regulator [Pseudomonadota bacterium]